MAEIKIEVLKEGTGQEAKKGDLVSLHYTLIGEKGNVIDSSAGGAPIEYVTGQGLVIQGWEKIVPGMKVGEKLRATIPAEYGYGAAGIPGVIAPNETLTFEMELVDVK